MTLTVSEDVMCTAVHLEVITLKGSSGDFSPKVTCNNTQMAAMFA